MSKSFELQTEILEGKKTYSYKVLANVIFYRLWFKESSIIRSNSIALIIYWKHKGSMYTHTLNVKLQKQNWSFFAEKFEGL